MNHRVNARLHSYPPCPECGAPLAEPCVTERATVRSPHNVRLKMAAGELAVVTVDEKALERAERAVVSAAMAASGDNVTRAAELLGTHRQSLQRRLRDRRRREANALRKGLKRAVDKAVDRVRGGYGLKTRSKG